MPGYTGYKPQADDFQPPSHAEKQPAQIPGMLFICFQSQIGYSGYVPGVKSENVFGESYGKVTGAANTGNIARGIDQPGAEKYKSMAQNTFTNQKEL